MSKAIKYGEIIGELPPTVILDANFSGIGEPFNVQGFTQGREYHPIAMFKYDIYCGDSILCFAIPDDEGKIRQVVVNKFRVPVGEGR